MDTDRSGVRAGAGSAGVAGEKSMGGKGGICNTFNIKNFN